MPTPVFPNAYQVEVRGFLFGQQVENVWHCQGADPFDPAQAATIASDFQVGYAAIMDNLSADLTVNEIFVHNLAGLASGEFTLAVTPPLAGGLSEAGMPGNVAFCVSLRTALSGRRFRGRKYFSGLGEGSVTGNALSLTIASNIVTAVQDLIGTLERAGTPMCIFSPTGLTLVPVIAATFVDLFIDSQRRRLTGRGR